MHEVIAKGIISNNNGINIYRGCTHGCIYCDSRSLCYGINHIFEDIEVKTNGPQLLEDTLRRKRKKCMIGTGAMSDPYILKDYKDKIFNARVSISNELPITKEGDKVNIRYIDTKQDTINITSFDNMQFNQQSKQ